MNEFATVESRRYLAETGIEDQKAKVEKQMRREREAMAQIKDNLEEREAEFDREADLGLAEPYDGSPDNDLRSLDAFWSE